MRKVFLLALGLFMAMSTGFATSANDPDDLQFDEAKINAELEQLNTLEEYVKANDGITLEELSAQKPGLTEGVHLEPNSIASVMADGDLPGNIPPFWWGLCLSWVGLLLVYILTDNDKDQVKKAFTGCLISTGVILLFYVVLWGIILGNYGWFVR